MSFQDTEVERTVENNSLNIRNDSRCTCCSLHGQIFNDFCSKSVSNAIKLAVLRSQR